MAYNNGFPVVYPQVYYPQPMQQPMPQPIQQAQQQPVQPVQPSPQIQPVSTGIIWVQGEAGAKSHLVAPNTTVALWDSEAQRIFLKSADAAGMPSMKILNYTIEETPTITAPVQRAVNGPVPVANTTGEFAGKAEQKALETEIKSLRRDLDSIRSDIDSFRGDLYGIAGKKPAINRKKDQSDE